MVPFSRAYLSMWMGEVWRSRRQAQAQPKLVRRADDTSLRQSMSQNDMSRSANGTRSQSVYARIATCLSPGELVDIRHLEFIPDSQFRAIRRVSLIGQTLWPENYFRNFWENLRTQNLQERLKKLHVNFLSYQKQLSQSLVFVSNDFVSEGKFVQTIPKHKRRREGSYRLEDRKFKDVYCLDIVPRWGWLRGVSFAVEVRPQLRIPEF